MTQGWKAQWGARIVAALVVIGSAAALASCEQKWHIVGASQHGVQADRAGS